MTTTTQNWMGINFSFDKVADESSKSGGFVGLQQCGKHKAELKNLYFSVIGAKERPALTSVFILEDSGKEIIENLHCDQMNLAEFPNSKQPARIRNLMTRILYSNLTEKEFKELSDDEINEKVTKALMAIQKKPASAEKLFGKKSLLDITQTPFIAKDKETKAIKLTAKDKLTHLNELPDALVKCIKNHEEYTETTLDKIPEFAFKNELKWYGCHFYNDFSEDDKFYNTKAYDYVQALKAEASTSTAINQVADDELIGEDEIPFN